MTDYEALAYASADLWLVLFVTDLALGIALVLLGREGRGRQSHLGEWELGDERS